MEELKVTLLDNKNNIIGYKNVGKVNSETDKIVGFNTEFTLGDLDYDGDISLLDIQRILRIVDGLYVPSDLQKNFADFNCDGRINRIDAQDALNYYFTGTK